MSGLHLILLVIGYQTSLYLLNSGAIHVWCGYTYLKKIHQFNVGFVCRHKCTLSLSLQFSLAYVWSVMTLEKASKVRISMDAILGKAVMFSSIIFLPLSSLFRSPPIVITCSSLLTSLPNVSSPTSIGKCCIGFEYICDCVFIPKDCMQMFM